MALPLRLGVMGILSHQDIAPLALSAANQASDRLINSFQPLSSNMDASQEAQPKSQHEHCKQLWEDQQNDLVRVLRRPVIRPDVQLLRLAIVAEGGD